MSFQTTICNNLHSYEFYGPKVPPCPTCGYPELNTQAAYYSSMGIVIEEKTINQLKEPTRYAKQTQPQY